MSGARILHRSLLLITVIVLPFLGLSCGSLKIGGTYLIETREQHEVSLPELERYYRERTGGLIARALHDSTTRSNGLIFTADPFNGRRIIAPPYCGFEEIQDLFTLDLDEYVLRSGAADLLDATHAAFRRMPFDERRGAPVRPYRTLAAWGARVGRPHAPPSEADS